MTSMLLPASLSELAEAVRSVPRLLAIGGNTKPRLSAGATPRLSTTGLRGITEYEPSEFTFTAFAGTRVKDLIAALAERGQYLPFDPMLVEAGSTLGGTVASGLSGPGRFRFGGLKDFILGVRFVDGAGRLLRMGGKVVKNAAGFDLPKFFVGSLGRFGVLAELTFKVFPRPPAAVTLKFAVNGVEAIQLLIDAANSRWEADALDILPDGKSVCLRLAGPAEALNEISRAILARWPGVVLPQSEADAIWADLCEFSWAYLEGPLIKVALTTGEVPALVDGLHSISGGRVHVSAGGDVAFVSLPSTVEVSVFNALLIKLGRPGLCLRGEAPLRCGLWPEHAIADRIKTALDPEQRFPDCRE